MHIALIQLTKKHTEIFGTFIEMIIKNDWEITIYYNLMVDEYSFVPYYLYLFKKEIPVKPVGYLTEDMDNIDYFIWTSSSDDNRMPEIFKSNKFANKSIFVQHQSAHLKDFMYKNIIVSPVITSQKLDALNPAYILPIYKSYSKLHYKRREDGKIIFAILGGIRGTTSGKIMDRNLDLIKDVIEEFPYANYEFQFFMRKWDWIWICKKRPFLKDNPKIIAYSGLQTPEMIKQLRYAKFILPIAKTNGWFHYQRLTGSIPFAINFNIPLILDKKLAQIYNLENSCPIYDINLLEIFGDLLKMNDTTYFKYIENIVNYKKNIYKQNCKIFKEIIFKNIPNIPIYHPQKKEDNLQMDHNFKKYMSETLHNKKNYHTESNLIKIY